MAPRPLRAPELLPNEPPPCEQAQATREHAAAIDRLTERFGPAADTIAGFGDRADALCKFLKSVKPFLWLGGMMILSRAVNVAPGELKDLLKSLGDFAAAVHG